MPFLPVTCERTESASDTGKCRLDFELAVREKLDKIGANQHEQVAIWAA